MVSWNSIRSWRRAGCVQRLRASGRRRYQASERLASQQRTPVPLNPAPYSSTVQKLNLVLEAQRLHRNEVPPRKRQRTQMMSRRKWQLFQGVSHLRAAVSLQRGLQTCPAWRSQYAVLCPRLRAYAGTGAHGRRPWTRDRKSHVDLDRPSRHLK